MCGAVYNSAIPDMLIRRIRLAHGLRAIVLLAFVGLGFTTAASAADWSIPEQHLAHKIVAVTGPGAVALTVDNRSSLGRRDGQVIQSGLRAALEGLGIRFVKAEQASATVSISLSENSTAYVWVAEIRQGATASVVMVSTPRPEGSTATHEAVPLSLRKTLLWSQDDPVLDVAVLEENTAVTRIGILEAERIVLYRLQSGKWQQEQEAGIVHGRPWPRDLRGRIVLAKDRTLEVDLPGVICRGSAGAALVLNCRDSDDPWPIVPAALNAGTFPIFPGAGAPSVTIPQMGAFYAATRNFFTGAITPGVGKFKNVSKFYSAAFLPREKYLLWLFASTDGHIHMVDGITDQTSKLDWGSDVATLKTSCGAGWQILGTTYHEETGDSVRAYEIPDRDPVAVSAAVDFSNGEITALWTEANSDTAIAVVRNRETGRYEAFRLAVACSQ